MLLNEVPVATPIEGVTSVGDVVPGRETQSPDPGSELRS
jgi:hypothetical protein